jgi:hypothetical protein
VKHVNFDAVYLKETECEPGVPRDARVTCKEQTQGDYPVVTMEKEAEQDALLSLKVGAKLGGVTRYMEFAEVRSAVAGSCVRVCTAAQSAFPASW